MRRHRYLKIFGLVAVLAGFLYLLVSLYLPSPRRLIFGVHKRTGRIRMVQQSVTFLPPHQFYRLDFEKRNGSAQRDGVIRILSKEGVSVRVSYRLRFGVDKQKIPDAARLVQQGWSAWLRARVAEAVSAVTTQIPVEDLASPLSDFSGRRQRLKQTVAEHLGRSGLKVTAFEISKIEIDRDALLKHKRAELRRNARGTIGRVAVFGIDGADWELLTELMIDGRIPNIEALVDGGASGTLQTIQPTVSPLLWTTVATGLTPDRHGVLDFVDRIDRGSPISSRSRAVPAIWDIAPPFGRTTGVVNWWTAWPPSPLMSFSYDAPVNQIRGAVHPADLASRVNPASVPEATIGFAQISRFLNIRASEYQNAISKPQPGNPIVAFRSVLSKTWSDHRAGIELFQARKPLLLMVNYDGTDAVNHLFAPYHPPYRDGLSEDNYRKFWPVVANYYSEIDRLIGEWMRILPPDTTVIIMSAHGMRWGKDRPRSMPQGTSALTAHRNPGVFIAFGDNVVPNRLRKPISIYDVTPTLLSLIGLPVSKEMQGKPALWAFKNVEPVSSVSITSYSELIDFKPVASNVGADPQDYRTRLQLIGHLTDPTKVLMPVLEDEAPDPAKPISAERWGMYAHFNNEGVNFQRSGRHKEAVEALEQAIDFNPNRPIPYLNLSLAYLEKGYFGASEEFLIKAIARGLPNPEQYLLDMASYYRDRDMSSRAVSMLLQGRELFPQSYAVSANLGSALAGASRYTEAMAELERALGLQPSSTLVLNNLGLIYLKKKDYGRALDYWNRSLAIDPRQPKIREASNAVQSNL